MRTATLRNPRDNARVGAFATVPGDRKYPTNLETQWGWFFRGDVDAGRVYVRRARYPVPPFDSQLAATSGVDDRYPSLMRDERETLWLAWQAGEGGAWLQASNDDGVTWETGVLMISGGQYPRVTHDPQTLFAVFAAYVGGVIVVRVRAPGETDYRSQVTVSGFGSLADDVFDLSFARNALRQLVFSVNEGGTLKEYVSTDIEDTSISVEFVG